MAVGWAGRQVLGGSIVQFPPANNKAVSRFQNTSGVDLTITGLYAVWNNSAGGGHSGFHAKGVVYTDTAALPDALVATGTEFTVIDAAVGTTPNAQAIPFAGTWVWPAGAWRWLGVISDTTLNTQLTCAIVTGGIKFNANTYGSGPSDPFGAAPSSADFEYPIWAEGYDGAHTLGRISIGGAAVGQYLKWDPHYERFALGGADAPVDGAGTVSVSTIAVYMTAAITAASHCAIYADDGGVSGKPNGATLLGVTNELASVAANTWAVYTFSPAIVITASGNYWLALITALSGFTCNVTQFHGQLSSAGAAETDPTFYTFANPVSATSPALLDQRPLGISIYATYAPIGAAQFLFPNSPEQILRRIQRMAY